MTAGRSATATSSLERTGGPHPGHAAYEWYTSRELLDLERRRILDHSWALVGTEQDIPHPGSYLAVTVGTAPLLIVRDKDGVVRGFHNLCRHRGLPLLQEQGTCGSYLTCQYHQWSYDLSGSLRRIPQQQEQFYDVDLDEWGLKPAAVGIWHGMLFANPDHDAQPLHDALGELAPRLGPFLDERLIEVARVNYTANCNWKLLVENHIDVYHLWYVHGRSLSMYEHRKFAWSYQSNNWWSYEPLKHPADAPKPSFGWLQPEEREGIGAHLLFPNLMLVTTGAYFATYDAVPVAPDQTALTLRIRSLPGADAEGLVASVRSFMAEDVAVCELLQRAAGSSQFSTGPLASTHEAPLREFHRAISAMCRG